MQAMIVRDEEVGDIPGIRKSVEAAFRSPLEANLIDRLRADGDSVISLVAIENGHIVGHILFSKMTAPFRALGLGPVSVMPDRQSSGIGSRLIREGLKRAGNEAWQGVFVVGNPSYYKRFGFSPGRAVGFASPYAGPHLMMLSLKGDIPANTGKIDYAPAFAALDI